jgi:hypothetical protein
MSVGQVDQNELARLCKEYQEPWIPIEFDVTEVHVIARKSDDEKMKVVSTIPLGKQA